MLFKLAIYISAVAVSLYDKLNILEIIYYEKEDFYAHEHAPALCSYSKCHTYDIIFGWLLDNYYRYRELYLYSCMTLLIKCCNMNTCY